MEDCNKNCCIFNYGTHYRFPIYSEMGKRLNVDFYLGENLPSSIKKFDYSKLPGFIKGLKNCFLGHFYWQKGSVGLVFKPYEKYILTGEPYCLSSWLFLVLSKVLRKKTIAWTHGWYGRESKLRTILKRTYFSLFSELLIYSDYAIGLMEKEGFKREKMFCIANSLDYYNQKNLRKLLEPTDIYVKHFHNNNPVVIYSGRVQKSKKIELIIDAAQKLREEGKSINIVIIGNDVDGVNIEKYAEGKNMGLNIWMYGACYDEKILAELFYNASVCVSPGNVGLTAIHALSYGCPVVTHDDFAYQGPEFESIKPGVTGDFFKKDDLNDLSRKIDFWISASNEKRDLTRINAFEEIDKKWNIEHQIEVLQEVLK